MTPLEVDESDATACSLLGLVDDRRSHFTYPHPAHRCFATSRPQATDLVRQQTFCLGPGYVTCDRYVASQRPVATADQQGSRQAGGVAAGSASATPIADTATTVIYVFRTGDSLARIAAAYGLTIEQIVATNHLDPHVAVKDGARLLIPIDRLPGDVTGAQRAGPRGSR